MRELSTNEMPNYLKQIIKIEISLYQLIEIREKTNNRLRTLNHDLKVLSTTPSRNSVSKPWYCPPVEPEKPEKPQRQKASLGDHFTLLGWAIDAGYTASANKKEEERYERELAQYDIALKKYKKDKEKYEKKYAEEMAAYDRQVKEADQKDILSKETLPLAIQRDTEARDTISKTISDTRKTLKKLYDMDVIFPKYRNLVAICSMYEYFVSGRVSQLQGADGAYNLYEAELRQNLIITQLDRIATKLDEIKVNQYLLYSELKKTNSYLNRIDKNLFKTLEVVQDISKSVEFSNCIQQSIAANTKAIKYISLIK